MRAGVAIFVVLFTAISLAQQRPTSPAPSAAQGPDRSKVPALGPAPQLTLPPIQKRTR